MRNSKKIAKSVLAGALVLAMGATTVFAGAGESYAASDVKLSKSSRNILTRRSYDFDVVGASANAVVTWKSNDEAIATVDANGVVTGVTKGETTITCEVKDGGKTTTLTATVRIRKPAVKIVIKNKISELKYGEKYDLNRTLTPSTSTDVTTWKSSDKSIATVDKNGVVTAKKNGTVTITATTMSGKTDSVKIKVYGAPAAQPTKAPAATKAPVAQPTKAPAATTAPAATKAPAAPTKAPAAPTKAPAATSATKYDITKLTQSAAGHWGVEVSGNKVAYSKQYAEAKYDLPKAVAVSDVKNIVLTLGSASDAVALKVYDESDTMIGVYYDISATSTLDIAAVNGSKIAKLGIMANNGECTVEIKSIELVLKAGASTEAPKAEPTKAPAAASGNAFDITKLKPSETGHWGVELAGNKITYGKQYNEAKFELGKALNVKDFKNVVLTLGSATDAVALKLYDESDTMVGVFYDISKTSTLDLAAVTGAKIAKVGIMANNGACTVEVKGIEFK